MKKSLKTLLFIFIVTTLVISSCAPRELTPTTTAETIAPAQSATNVIPSITPAPSELEFGVDPGTMNELQIQFIHPWTGGVLDELVRMVDEFNQTNEWGIHVIMNAPGSAAMVTNKTWEGIANHQPPNVLVAPASFILAVDEREELVMDLAPYLYSPGYGLSTEAIEDFSPIFWDELMVDRKRIGIPAQQSALLLAYNQTWAQELGFTKPPATEEEFRSQMCAANAFYLKDGDTTNDGLGGWLINIDPVAMLSWLYAFGVEPRLDSSNVFSGDEGEAAFKYLLELKADSCAWAGRTGQDFAYFTNHQALAVTVWQQDLPTLARELERSGSQDEWTVIPFPGSTEPMVTTAGSAFSVLQNSPEEDLAAWLFIRWFAQPVQQVRLLSHFGTLPLSSQAETLVDQDAQLPQWKTTLEYADFLRLQPVDADWMIISPVLEDAGWQLLKAGIPVDQVPDLLIELDTLISELSERYP